MGIHGPAHFVDMAGLALARDVKPAKNTRGGIAKLPEFEAMLHDSILG